MRGERCCQLEYGGLGGERGGHVNEGKDGNAEEMYIVDIDYVELEESYEIVYAFSSVTRERHQIDCEYDNVLMHRALSMETQLPPVGDSFVCRILSSS